MFFDWGGELCGRTESIHSYQNVFCFFEIRSTCWFSDLTGLSGYCAHKEELKKSLLFFRYHPFVSDLALRCPWLYQTVSTVRTRRLNVIVSLKWSNMCCWFHIYDSDIKWYRRYFDIAGIFILQVFWYSSYYGIAGTLIWQLLWYSRYFDMAGTMVSQVLFMDKRDFN